MDSPDIVRKSQSITGGAIAWTEDRSTINALSQELSEANDRIEEENDLIAESNRIEAEYTRYETLNRLYDLIADHCRDQAERLENVLSDETAFEEDIVLYLILGTYVKRSANLMLLANSSLLLPLDELCYALRETFECISISGIDCILEKAPGKKSPSELVIAAHDLFEAAVEAVYGKCSIIVASAAPNSGTVIRIETDAPLSWDDIPEKLRIPALSLTVTDEESCLTLGGDIIG